MSKKAELQRYVFIDNTKPYNVYLNTHFRISFHEERNTLLKFVLQQLQKQNKLALLPNATIADLQFDSILITPESLEGKKKP
jgi:hypothetical protein